MLWGENMKLIDILNKLYETTKEGAPEEEFYAFLDSLELKDYELLLDFAKEMIDLSSFYIYRLADKE